MRSAGAVNVETSESADSQSHRHILRTANFWRRVSSIYVGYKVAQVKATYLKWRGHSPEDIRTNHWQPVHEQSGQDMYQLCVDMRGFLIKVLNVSWAILGLMLDNIRRFYSLYHGCEREAATNIALCIPNIVFQAVQLALHFAHEFST